MSTEFHNGLKAQGIGCRVVNMAMPAENGVTERGVFCRPF